MFSVRVYFHNIHSLKRIQQDILGEAKQMVDLLGQEEVPQCLPRQKVLSSISKKDQAMWPFGVLVSVLI